MKIFDCKKDNLHFFLPKVLSYMTGKLRSLIIFLTSMSKFERCLVRCFHIITSKASILRVQVSVGAIGAPAPLVFLKFSLYMYEICTHKFTNPTIKCKFEPSILNSYPHPLILLLSLQAYQNNFSNCYNDHTNCYFILGA